jgi:hypothetical protein
VAEQKEKKTRRRVKNWGERIGRGKSLPSAGASHLQGKLRKFFPMDALLQRSGLFSGNAHTKDFFK